MPAVRLLALAPAPGQQLQLLRSAGSASSSSTTRTKTARDGSYTKDSNGRSSMKSPSSSSRAMSTAAAAAAPHVPPTQPSWCRGASPAMSLFHTRVQRPTTASGANASSQRARIYQQQPRATSRAFGSATMPKQVAFPRHGKAVAPQETPITETTEKEASTTTEEATKTSAGEVKATSAASPEEAPAAAEEKKPAKKNGKRAKAAAAADAKAKEDAATAPSEQPAASAASVKPASSTEPTDSTKSPTSPGPSSATVDAQETFGRTVGAEPSTIPSNPAGVVAEAAAASTTAAETASVAADILGGASPVIELGPPKVAIGAILEPGQREQGQSDQQQQQQQQQQHQQQQGSEDQASSSSQRHSLSQNKLLPPHLAPPPYVHHFDSYSLVKQLEAGGYKQEQAITAMKAVRSLLAQNLDVAQAGLVSKSDVENEAYLFKAACAELSIEVRNNRRRADELVRQQRTLLQHEVDIAAQSVNQELVTLADVVKELFNDRKMAVREEQKALESAIQQLSYKITIMLNSEMRSEIEGLRWVLIRRSVLGIIFMAILTLGTLRYASYVSHEKKNAAERALREAHEAEMQRFADTKVDTSAPPDAAEILAAN